MSEVGRWIESACCHDGVFWRQTAPRTRYLLALCTAPFCSISAACEAHLRVVVSDEANVPSSCFSCPSRIATTHYFLMIGFSVLDRRSVYGIEAQDDGLRVCAIGVERER